MALICALALFGACKNPSGGGTKSSVSVTEVTISPESTPVDVGKTVQLQAVVKPDNASNKKLTWTSSNNAVATVDNTGLVSGVSAGPAVITATSVNGITGTAAVSVSNPVPLVGISLAPNPLAIAGTGNTGSFTVTYNPADTTEKGITWVSGNTAVATVNASTGLVTAVSAGTAAITATSTANSAITASANVTVTVIDITGIALNKTTLALNKGGNETLTVTYNPDNTTEKGLVWTSSNEAVATVSNGVVTAVGAGTATITAASTVHSTITATCAVTVTAPLIGISLTPNPLNLSGRGTTGSFTVVYDPADTTDDKGVTWASNNEAVATVSGGTVTAVANGTATITATSTAKTGISANVAVNVTVIDITGINLPSAITMAVGSGYPMPVGYSPSDTTEKGLTWTSDNEAVVTVSGGTITALAVGSANITATSTANGAITASCAVTVLATYNGAGINIVFEGLEDETIVLNEPISEGFGFILTAPAGFDRYRWYLDGNYWGYTTNPTSSLYDLNHPWSGSSSPVPDLTPGRHYITVIVDKDGYQFSKTLVYRIGY
jgi:uncharacterized protein YjdB